MSVENQLPSDQTELSEAEKRQQWEARRNKINAEVSALIRNPFQRIVADYLACAPSPQAISAFAEKFPDRYAAALAQIAPLAGFQKEVNVQTTNLHLVGHLPDSALSARLIEAEQKLLAMQQQRFIVEQPNAGRDPAKLEPIPERTSSTTQGDNTSPGTNAPGSEPTHQGSDSSQELDQQTQESETDPESGETLRSPLSRLAPESRTIADDQRTIDAESRFID